MIKRIRTAIAIIVVFMIATAFTVLKPSRAQGGKSALRTIIIDPGHGGAFHGTHGLISREEDVTLEISLKLGKAIEKEFPDVKVIYTRTVAGSVNNASTLRDDLRSRAQIANQSKGDLFISIHCNATPQPPGGWYAKRVIGHKKVTRMVGKGKKRRKKVVNEPIYESYWVKNTRTGTETYIWASDRSAPKGDAINQAAEESGEFAGDSTASAEAEASAFDINSPEARIRTQLYEKNFFNKSALLSKNIEDQFKARGRISYGVKQRDKGIQVLQATGMPSILVETGFLTNKEEEEYLNSEKGQDEVVSDIIEGLRIYKQQVEGGKK